MTNGQLTSRDLVLGYLDRIQQLNPTLHAVIETNPYAVSIAAGLDNEHRNRQVRGPLDVIPILVKDNIATLDNMQTTAGSVAIYGNQVPADAPLIQNLRAAGAIILGKANLGEWANFRDDEAETYPLAVGWSARGGSTNNAYDLSYTSWGSSSGSGAGAAASLCAAAVGTETVAFANHALDVMASLGATIVDTDTGDVFAYNGDEFTALLYEFRAQIADYLQSLSKTDMRTLADLIAFNSAHCPQELVYYDQDVFLLAEQFVGYPNDPNYIAARSHATSTARAGIDNAMTSQNLHAIVAPHLTNSTGPAVAGYPNFSMPVGIRSSGRPAGMLMYSTAFREAQLIAMAYDLEKALNARQQPQLLGAIQPIPNGGFCTGHQPQGKAHLPHGRIF